MRAQFEAAARTARSARSGLPPAGDMWIGDDAAVVAPPRRDRPDRVVLATDLVVERGPLSTSACARLEDVGCKALMVTVSDFAAMGVRPDHALVSVAAPAGTDSTPGGRPGRGRAGTRPA